MKSKKIFHLGIIIFLIPLFFILPLIVGFGKTGQDTKILDKDFSLLNKKQIIERIDNQFPLPANLVLKYENRTFNFNLASASAQINKSKTASNLLFRRLNQGILKYIRAFFSPKNFSLEIGYDSNALDQFISQISSQIDKPFVPSELILDETQKVQVKNGQLGTKTNTALLKQNILDSLSFYKINSTLDIPVESVGSLPSSEVADQTISRAEKIIGKSFVLSSSDQKIILDDKILISWLDFNSSCRTDKVSEYVDNLAQNIKKDAVDAVFKFENKKVLEFKPSSNGYYLNNDQLKSSLCRRFSDLFTISENNLALDLPLIPIEAKIKNSDVNNLGIKELLGKGVSTFKHSNATRNFNIEKGASIVNRILVAPGETFSFVKNLGEVTLDAGFKEAYIIREGRTELDVGGGICQVSTTFFRAMLDAGLDITERQPHAYRVSYYEEDSPPGYDATVFVPKPDLKFVNDTGNYLLIQNTFDSKNKVLTYEIYGTSDGRKAEINNYRKWDNAPPPPTKYIDDPNLRPGQLVQDEHAIPGLKTAFDWKVMKNGEVLHQKTFQSVYVPWAAVYRRGI